jgi:hypothetical protein
MSTTAAIKEILGQSVELFRKHKAFFFMCQLVLLSMDLSSFFFQKQFSYDPEVGRWIEVGYQLILVYMSVCFFHTLSFLERDEKVGALTILGEGLLLTPGFVLQSIFFGLTLLAGSLLLVIPGLIAFVLLYFNPLLAVVYPDYEGKTFLLGPELIRPHWKVAIGIILLSGLFPFLPEGGIWLATGSLKSWLTPLLAPLDGALYIFCETVAYQFIYTLVLKHRNSDKA